MARKSKETYIIDTNIIVRLLTEDDVDQLKITRQSFFDMEKNISNWIIPHGIINEVLFVTSSIYNIPKKYTIKELTKIMKQWYIINTDKKMIILSLEASLEYNISFMDSYLLQYSKINNHTLITFDKKLLKLSR